MSKGLRIDALRLTWWDFAAIMIVFVFAAFTIIATTRDPTVSGLYESVAVFTEP